MNTEIQISITTTDSGDMLQIRGEVGSGKAYVEVWDKNANALGTAVPLADLVAAVLKYKAAVGK